MLAEFRDLYRTVCAAKRDVFDAANTVLAGFHNKLRVHDVRVFVIVTCPFRDCTGHAILDNKFTPQQSIVCNECKRRVDVARFRL